MMDKRYVYAIEASDRSIKIGIATNARARFSAIKTSSPLPLSLAFVGECEASAASEIERAAHEILQENHKSGEWFSVPVTEAVDAVLAAASRLGYVIRQVDITAPSRPPQTGEPVQVRLQPDLRDEIDTWRRKQSDLPNRAEAIRRLVKIAIKRDK